MFKIIYKFAMQKAHKIAITPLEREIFDMFLECRTAFGLKTTIRVAGGWVRDKLMQKESNDIDITLDDMKGEQFALMFKDYFTKKNEKVSGFGVTRLNPDLSKHLQTAKITIKDREIDIVNLRSQKYTEDTRIPQIEIGTPRQDAERRDLTINSLFYNIISQEVEDWTGQGLTDLENQVIRTPLEPYLTFKDDPLRILRSFRFAGRFKFKVVPQLFEAAKKPQIKEALRVKVSKERVGKEVSSMLKSSNPYDPLKMIYDNDFWNLVFEIPAQSDLKDPAIIEKIPLQSLKIFERACKLLQKTHLDELKIMSRYISKDKPNEALQAKTFSPETLNLSFLLASLTFVYLPYTVIVNKKKQSLIRHIIKESLKLPGKQAQFAHRICAAAEQLKENINNIGNPVWLIKWLRATGQVWECAILLAEVIYQLEQIPQLWQHIQKHGFEQAYNMHPFIDGSYVTKSLGKNGPAIKTILDNSAIWRCLHPDKSKQQFMEQLHKNPEQFENRDMYK